MLVILAGMEAPPNYGREYTVSFRQVFRDVAQQEQVTFLPFLLDKVAGQPALNQGDGIHPNMRRRRDRRRHGVERAPAGAGSDRRLMIELRGVCKRVPSGTGMLTILHPLDLTHPVGPRRRDHRAVGQRQVDAARAARRARRAVDGQRHHRRRRHHGARRGRAGAVARPADRLRLPVLPPAAVADRARERARADGDCRRQAARPRAPTRCWPRSVSPTARITIRRSSRAASSSASRSRARSPTIRRCCSPTSRPATSTARPATRSSSCCSTSTAPRKTTIVLVTHDPELAALADVTIALRDGRVARLAERDGGDRPPPRYELRPADGGARAARLLAAAAVLLRLRRHRRRRDRRAALDRPERARRADARSRAPCSPRDVVARRPTAAGRRRRASASTKRSPTARDRSPGPTRSRPRRWCGRDSDGGRSRGWWSCAAVQAGFPFYGTVVLRRRRAVLARPARRTTASLVRPELLAQFGQQVGDRDPDRRAAVHDPRRHLARSRAGAPAPSASARA